MNPDQLEKEELEEIRLPYHYEDSIGILDIRYDQEVDSVVLEIKGPTGRLKKINDLLPESVKMSTRSLLRPDIGSSYDDDGTHKRVVISVESFEQEGWKYLLTILHEIGHAARANSSVKEEKDEYEELAKLQFERTLYPQPPELFEKFILLKSKDERKAWAFAIDAFRKLTQKLEIPREEIFTNLDELMAYINRYLNMYYSSAHDYREERARGVEPVNPEEYQKWIALKEKMLSLFNRGRLSKKKSKT